MDGISARVVLGLAPDAPRREVKRAWRELAKQHHPDTGGEPRAFQALVHARDAGLRAPEQQRPRHEFVDATTLQVSEASRMVDTNVVELDRFRRRKAYRSFAEELELAMRR